MSGPLSRQAYTPPPRESLSRLFQPILADAGLDWAFSGALTGTERVHLGSPKDPSLNGKGSVLPPILEHSWLARRSFFQELFFSEGIGQMG